VRTTAGNWGETMYKIHVRSETNKSSNQSTKLGKHGNIFKAHVKFTCYATHVLQTAAQQGLALNKVTCCISTHFTQPWKRKLISAPVKVHKHFSMSLQI